MPQRVGRFNPRTREGANAVQSSPPPCDLGFNPRTREGANANLKGEQGDAFVSIHAPVKVRTYN